jgi:Zinc-ribbon containing domain
MVRGRADEVSTNDAQGMPRVLQSEEDPVANPVPAGSDVSSGTYRCTNCDNEIQMESRGHVPPCPSCGNGEWDTVRGGDSVNDPYPDRLA